MLKQLMLSVFLLFAGIFLNGMETFENGVEFDFRNPPSNFKFKATPYTGVQFNGFNFFVHIPCWEEKKRLPDLRIHKEPISSRLLAEDDCSQTFLVTYPLAFMNESKGVFFSAPHKLHVIFKQWKGFPVLSCSFLLENCGKKALDAQLYLIGTQIPKNAEVTSIQWSPPPAHVLTEKLAVKFQMSTSEFFMLKGENRSFGIISKNLRNYTGYSLELFWKKFSVLPGGKSEAFDIQFVSNVNRYEDLSKISGALKLFSRTAFAQKVTKKPSLSMDCKNSIAPFLDKNGFALQQTAGRFFYDDNYIYGRLSAFDSAMKKRKMRFLAAGDPIYTDDCLELSLASDWESREYWHFMVNPHGTKGFFVKNHAPTQQAEMLWNVSAKDASGQWNVLFSIDKQLADPKLLAREKCVMIHLNREAHFHREFSGWPSEKFHSPENFGRLILDNYKNYLSTQLDLCRELLKDTGNQISRTDADFLMKNHTISSGDWFNNVMLDWKISGIKKELSFQHDLKEGLSLIDKMRTEKDAQALKIHGKTLLHLMKRLEKNALELKKEALFNQLRSAYLSFASKGKSYLIWEKSPWTYIGDEGFPAIGGSKTFEQKLNLGIGEYESASAAFSNFSKNPAVFQISVSKNPGLFPIELRYGFPVKSSSGMNVNDALPRLVENCLEVPPFSTRELWITVYSEKTAPGEYPVELTVKAPGGLTEVLRFSIKVYPVRLKVPSDFGTPFYSLFIGRLHENPKYIQAFRKSIESHYARTVTIGGFPVPHFDKDGKNRTNYNSVKGNFRYIRKNDKVLYYWTYKTNALKEYLDAFEKGLDAPFMSEIFQKRFKIWLDGWMAEIRRCGYDNEIFMYPFDEKIDPMVFSIIKLMKKSSPYVKIYLTLTTTASISQIREITPFIDVPSPHFYTWCKNAEFWKIMKENNRVVWPYFNVHPCSSPDEGYSVYRKMGWNSFDRNCTGFGTWIYFQPFFHSWTPPDMSMVYVKTPLLEKAFAGAPEKTHPEDLVITSKRWEGYREGAEDYFYLRTLEKLVKKEQNPVMKTEALNLLKEAVRNVVDSPDHAMANTYKKKILEMISRVSGNR